jgi:hypothetical protein
MAGDTTRTLSDDEIVTVGTAGDTLGRAVSDTDGGDDSDGTDSDDADGTDVDTDDTDA